MKTDFIAPAGKICEQDVLVATRGYNFQRSLRKWFYMLGNALICLFLKAWVKIFRALQTMWRWLLWGVFVVFLCYAFASFGALKSSFISPFFNLCLSWVSIKHLHDVNSCTRGIISIQITEGNGTFISKSAGVGAVMATEKQKSSLYQAALPFKVVCTDMSLQKSDVSLSNVILACKSRSTCHSMKMIMPELTIRSICYS